jgi:hypothetical protein
MHSGGLGSNKITFAEMRAAGVHGPLAQTINRSHSIAIGWMAITKGRRAGRPQGLALV